MLRTLAPCPLPPLPPAPAAKVRGDHILLQQLATAVSKTKASYDLLQTEHRELAVELQAAEAERAALASQFASKAAALGDLEGRHEAACALGKELQGKLDEAAGMHTFLLEEGGKAVRELDEKVGARPKIWVLGQGCGVEA